MPTVKVTEYDAADRTLRTFSEQYSHNDDATDEFNESVNDYKNRSNFDGVHDYRSADYWRSTVSYTSGKVVAVTIELF